MEFELCQAPWVDVDELMERCGGDRDLLREVVALFVNDVPSLFDALSTSLSAMNQDALVSSAHRLHGMLLTMAATRAAGTARTVEMRARAGEITAVDSLVYELKHELAATKATLGRIASSQRI